MSAASNAKNRKYVAAIQRQFSALPKEIALEASVLIFKEMVVLTRFDSGQAALNWRVQTFTGSPKFEPQRMVWGYGNKAPVGLADYKHTKGRKEAAVKSELIEFAYAMKVSMQRQKFDGITVYNPITPGFTGFWPGDDLNYEKNALGKAKTKVAAVVGRAMSETKAIMKSRYSFVGGR